MTDYTIRRGGMVSSWPRQEIAYQRYEGVSGYTWYVGEVEEAAQHVYADPHDPKSQGFGGMTMTFPLVDGTSATAKGPWKSNSDALFADTGVDVRDRVFTFVVLSKGIAHSGEPAYDRILTDVVHQDEAPVLGRFCRYRELIAEHPEANYYYSESSGGSSSGAIHETDRATGTVYGDPRATAEQARIITS